MERRFFTAQNKGGVEHYYKDIKNKKIQYTNLEENGKDSWFYKKESN